MKMRTMKKKTTKTISEVWVKYLFLAPRILIWWSRIHVAIKIINNQINMKKTREVSYLAFLVVGLFVVGVTMADISNKLVPVASGEEDGGDRDESKNEEDEKDEAKDEEDKDDEKKGDEDDKREVKKNKQESSKKINKVEDEEDADEAHETDEDENEEDKSSDIQKEIRDLNKDTAKVESKINVLSTNGVVVTSFVAALADIQGLISQAQSRAAVAPKEAETFIETADQKLERLEKLIKMTLGDEDEGNDDGDAIEEIQDLAKDIVRLEVKFNELAAEGTDVSALRTTLDGIKDLLNQAREKAGAGDLAGAEATTELADKKLETLKKSIELVFGDDEVDGDEAKEYKNEVAQFVHNLKELGEIEGGIGQQVRVVAQAQNDARPKVENAIEEIKSRSEFVKFLIGPKYGSIGEVETAITENQTRINVLVGLIEKIDDPAAKIILQEQISSLQLQNAKLQIFLVDSDKNISLFGWLAKLFS